MKIYTSYFYQLRFFKPNEIPISTAKWDPKWYHDFKDSSYVFQDKNGVLNGLRAPDFAISDEFWEKSQDKCMKGCPQDPSSCSFMKLYSEYLNTLDFNNIMSRLENLIKRVQNAFPIKEEPVIILMVHESSTNPCSERNGLQKWFSEHGVQVEEWSNEKESG